MYALDAAMPFDFEAKANARMKHASALRIGIVGFGTFGQFLAKRLIQAGHKVTLLFCGCTLHNSARARSEAIQTLIQLYSLYNSMLHSGKRMHLTYNVIDVRTVATLDGKSMHQTNFILSFKNVTVHDSELLQVLMQHDTSGTDDASQLQLGPNF